MVGTAKEEYVIVAGVIKVYKNYVILRMERVEVVVAVVLVATLGRKGKVRVVSSWMKAPIDRKKITKFTLLLKR